MLMSVSKKARVSASTRIFFCRGADKEKFSAGDLCFINYQPAARDNIPRHPAADEYVRELNHVYMCMCALTYTTDQTQAQDTRHMATGGMTVARGGATRT